MLATLREAVKQGPFVVLDTETTGLHGEVCQIAILSSEREILLDQHVKPVDPIPLDASRIHGITDDMVKNAPTWGDVEPRVIAALYGKTVIVYHAKFDRHILYNSAERAGLPKTAWKEISTWVCAMKAFAEFYGDWNEYYQSYRWQKLSFAAEYCNIPVQSAHNTLAGCIMTLGVIGAICNDENSLAE